MPKKYDRRDSQPDIDDILDPAAERLKALTSFVASLTPAIGERSDGEHFDEEAAGTSPLVMEARNVALVAAFEAIERIVGKMK